MTQPIDPQLQQQLLNELRDIRLPEPVSWWPPAPGWWLLSLVVLGVLIFITIKLHRRWKSNRYRRIATHQLTKAQRDWQQHGDPTSYLQAANLTLKLALKKSGNPKAQRMLSQAGHAWSEALNAHSTSSLSPETSDALAIAVYRDVADHSLNIEQIHHELIEWISSHTFDEPKERP